MTFYDYWRPKDKDKHDINSSLYNSYTSMLWETVRYSDTTVEERVYWATYQPGDSQLGDKAIINPKGWPNVVSMLLII